MATDVEINDPGTIFSEITPVDFADLADIGIYDIGPAIVNGAVGATNPCFLPSPLEGVIPEIDVLANVDPGFTVDGSIGEILADGFALLGQIEPREDRGLMADAAPLPRRHRIIVRP